MEKDRIISLVRSKRTIFTIRDFALFWPDMSGEIIKKTLYRYVNSGRLHRLRRGIYALNEDYDRYELATRLFTPCYISFETVLVKAGIVFQFYSSILAASYLSREIKISGQGYVFHKLNAHILTNHAGIEDGGNYAIASPERAFLDVLYINKEYHFDNLVGIDWAKVDSILPIYGDNQRMAARIKRYKANFLKR